MIFKSNPDVVARCLVKEKAAYTEHALGLFKNMDKNNDGVVSKQEFMTICTNLTDEQVKMAFSKFDTSGDDKLDYREFCEMIKQKEMERNG